MFNLAHSLDVQAFRLINSEWTSAFLDWGMAWISDFGIWWIPLLAATAGIAYFGRFKERIFLILLGFCLLIGDAGLVQGIREIVNRPRPWQALDNVRFVDKNGVEIRQPSPWKKGRSMPSGHVCNNTAAAVLATIFYFPWGILLWGWALLIGYARIYTGAHYPSDVLISIPLATCYTVLIYLAARGLWKKYAPQFCPNLYKGHPTLK